VPSELIEEEERADRVSYSPTPELIVLSLGTGTAGLGRYWAFDCWTAGGTCDRLPNSTMAAV